MKICPCLKMKITKCFQNSTFSRSYPVGRRSLQTKVGKNPMLCALALPLPLMDSRAASLAHQPRLVSVGIFLCALLVPALALGQGPGQTGRAGKMADGPRGANQGANQRAGQWPNPSRQARPGQRPHPPGFFQRLRELPPAEQERVMANNERFRSLPPERQ